MLAQVLARIARRDSVPELRGRVSVRGASDLIPLLADPEVLADGPDRHDARDLLAAYRDLLGELRGRVSHFASRPLSDWTEGDFYGLFARCRAERLASMADATIGRAIGAEAGVSGCEWLHLPIPGGELWLQFEDARLCVKLRPAQESQRKRVREQVDAALQTLGLVAESEGAAPGRLVATPRRFGSVMTVACLDGLLEDLSPGLPALGAALHGVEGDGARRRPGAELTSHLTASAAPGEFLLLYASPPVREPPSSGRPSAGEYQRRANPATA